MRVYEKSDEATRYTLPLSPKKVKKKTITTALMFLALWFAIPIIIVNLLMLQDVVDSVYSMIYWSLALIFLPTLALVPLFYRYQQLYFKAYYYDLKPDLLIIRKGVWAPHEIRLPYHKIQNVYVDRDLLDVAFGLYDVHLATADSASNLYAHIDGLNEENAVKLRDILLKRIEGSTKSDGV